jgi:NAD kinase
MALPLSIFSLSTDSTEGFLDDIVIEAIEKAISHYREGDYAECQTQCQSILTRKSGKIRLTYHLTLLIVFCASSRDFHVVAVRMTLKN